MRFRAQPTEVRSVLFTAKENLEKLRTLESRLESAAVFSDIDRIETALDQDEVEGEVLRAATEQRSSEVLADFAVLGRHQERARGLRNGLVTARYATETHITTVSVVRVNGLADAVCLRQTHGGKNDKMRTISDTEALQAFRCPEHEEIAAVAFQTIDGLVKRTISEFINGGSYPADSVRHVASVALIPQNFPRHLTPNTSSENS